ncbi:hypothetical protein HPB50_014178 [Hyalomma asiaticum]|uniref:Uncharacterized protein n=1 Tax=Hyalomma asiaticum TaxID=266040 RepID=A0ACB7SQ22_HYAAI|nr:hypothetical protein HPB50_014178 [Hyalomma asiaticum]
MDIHQDNAKNSHGSAEEEGWHVVQRERNRRAGNNKESDANDDYNNNAEAGSKAKAQTRNHARLLVRIQKTSRMPRLPAGDYKVVIRPRGGLSVAQLAFEERESDVICPNKTQNILVVSTPDPDRADQYRQIKQITERHGARSGGVRDSTRGYIQGSHKRDSSGPRCIEFCWGALQPPAVQWKVSARGAALMIAAVPAPENPTVITAKRLGNTTAVIVLFSGNKAPSSVCYAGVITRCTLYRKQIDFCKQCNRIGHRSDVCPNPNDRLCPGGHTCVPKCRMCGRDHATGDRNCKAKYKKPFIIKQRQWARIQDDHREAPPQARGRSRSRSRSRERQRSRSTTRGSTPGRARSRSRSTSKGPPNKVSWADKAREPRPAETGESVKHHGN